MIRYVIHQGDKTSANGTVLANGQSLHSGFGQDTALVGDSVICPACQSTGVIVAYGPRPPMTISDRDVALSGDKCQCKCPKMPDLLAVQQTISVTVSDPSPPPVPAEQIAARGVSEGQEAECHAQYEVDMEMCQFERAMRGNRAYAACTDRAFQRYQSCRGY